MPLMYYKHYKRSVKQSSLFCVLLELMEAQCVKRNYECRAGFWSPPRLSPR